MVTRTVCADTKFGTGMHLDNILDKFDGLGLRSKVKVTRLGIVIFGQYFPLIISVVTSRHKVR